MTEEKGPFMPTDIEIAHSVEPWPIQQVAEAAGVDAKHLIPYGFDKAKVDYSLLNEPSDHEAKLVLVTAINPTPAGEGKTTTTIGLADALRRRGVKSAVALREPSLGPVFGVKGGAAGGGYAQVIPMEDFSLDIVIGKGPAARAIRLDIPRFTLVGATTRSGMLTGPLRDRFGISYRLDYYGIEDLADIVCRSSSILGVSIDRESAKEIASRSRGTPRLANRLLKRVRDYAQVRGEGSIELGIAQEAMRFFEIDELGLDWMDIRILETLCKTFRGRAVGLSTLASATGEDANTLEDVYEPYLLQCGLIVRTPQGRMATPAAFEHLGVEAPGL